MPPTKTVSDRTLRSTQRAYLGHLISGWEDCFQGDSGFLAIAPDSRITMSNVIEVVD
jgi:hypothetical protein